MDLLKSFEEPEDAWEGSLAARNDFDLQAHVRRIFRLMRPQRAIGHTKDRFGNAADGGYVQLDDFAGVNVALSFGIRDDVSWDLAIADQGIMVHQFDHTVDAPVQDPRLRFNKTRIAAQAGAGCATLGELVEQFADRNAPPNLLLKIDIDGDEWPVFDAAETVDLACFAQISCELHSFENLYDLAWRDCAYRVLRKLSTTHALVHIHGNNFAPTFVIANTFVPSVLEATFVHRALYDLEDTDELFPGLLDQPCNPGLPDIFLGAFRY